MNKGNPSSIFANLGAKLSLSKITESIARLSSGKRTAFGYDAGAQSIANNLRADSASNMAASNNLQDALAALQVAKTSLDEIGALNTRLAEIGILNTNNSLLSTNDVAALNKETASITTAIDNIVSNTKYNSKNLLNTSNVSLTIGASPNGTNQLTITIGGISSIASVTAASSATSTANTLETTVANDQGQVAGATLAAKARRDVTSTSSAILKSAAVTIESVDIAAETARLTRNILLHKVSLSLSAQANNVDAAKLDLLG